MVFIPREILMSPGFRSVLRFARIPVDSSEPVRRKFGSRLIGIVTLCLLPLLVFDVPQWGFILSQVIWGRASILACPWPETRPGHADILSDLLKKEQLTRRLS
jgi:hypothetical protein